MKTNVILICTLFLFISCNSHKGVIKINNSNKSQSDYYTISNSFGKDKILKDYDKKEIIIEKIILNQNINGINIFIGNIMGSKSAVFIGKNKDKIVFSEEIGYIKSYSLKKVSDIDFILLTLKYADFCEYVENTIIYSCYNNKIYQCFDFVTKEEYNNEDPMCLGGEDSYVKKLDINKKGDYIKIDLQKNNNESSEYIYSRKKHKFVLSILDI